MLHWDMLSSLFICCKDLTNVSAGVWYPVNCWVELKSVTSYHLPFFHPFLPHFLKPISGISLLALGSFSFCRSGDICDVCRAECLP